MDALEIVKAWNQTLRIGDWQAARGILADDATSTVPEAPEGEGISCTTPDQIVDFLRSLKGELPDVEVVGWETHGAHVLARLRQPAFGEGTDWFQVLSVDDGLITRLEDYPTRESAAIALARTA